MDAMKQTLQRYVGLAYSLLAALPLCSQYGSIVPDFNQLDDGQFGDGAVQYHASYSEPNGLVSSIVERQDGRVLIAGNYRTYNGEPSDGINQLLPDGRIDPSFSLVLPSGFAPVASFIELSDGSLLLVGRAPATGFLLPYAIKRVLPNGALDPAFSVVANSIISVMHELPDGRIIVAGMFTAVNGVPAGRIARLMPDGTFDQTFSTGTGGNNAIRALVPEPDGSLLIGGSFNEFDGVPRRGLARLGPDGALDAAYDPMASAVSTSVAVNALALDAQGRCFVGGGFNLSGQIAAMNLVRLLSDGSVDGTFGMINDPNGTVRAIAVRGDGSVVVGGSFTAMGGISRNGLAALHADGQLDETFLADLGHAYGPEVYRIEHAGNGDLLVGGRISAVQGRFRLGIARLTAGGSLVTGFNPGRGAGGLINALAQMADGRIAIAGDFISYNDEPRQYLAFLTANGELHPVFSGGSGPNAPIEQLVALPNGGFFIAGRFTEYNGVAVPRMAVVDAFGVSDQTVAFPFPSPSLAMRFTSALALPDGSIVVAYAPESQTSESTTTLVRYLANGSLDASFNPPSPIYGRIYALARGLNGSIVLGGNHRLGSMTAPLGISRLLANGAIDHTFGTGNGIGTAGSSAVMALAPLPDGRLIIGGYFNHYRNSWANGIACLNADGSHCANFSTQGVTSGAAVVPAILSIAPLPDGRLVLCGWFDSFAGAPHRSVAVALPDGTQDPSFQAGSGAEYLSTPWVRQVLVTPEGDYLVQGLFHRFDGHARHRIAKLMGGGGVWIDDQRTSDDSFRIWPSVADDRLFTSNAFSGVIRNMVGAVVLNVNGASEIDVRLLAPGHYIAHDHTGRASRFVKR